MRIGAGNSAGFVLTEHGNTGVVKFKEYIKTPQRIYLEDVNDNFTWEHPIFEVFWVTAVNAAHLNRYIGATTSDPIGVKIAKNTLYFNELSI